MDMGFGTWNVMSLYRAGVINYVLAEAEKYKMDFVGMYELWRKDYGTFESGNFTLLNEKAILIIN